MSATVADLRALLERAQPGAVRVATETQATSGVLPVAAALRPLFPGGGLRRGTAVEIGVREDAVPVGPRGRRPSGSPSGSLSGSPSGSPSGGYDERPGAGGCSLVLALLAEASAAGSWCVLVGAPGLGLAAAAEVGIDLSRFALVPAPGQNWARAVGALLDGFDLVVARPPADLAPAEARALTARARHHGTVLVSLGPWPGAQVRLTPVHSRWEGLGNGHGRLSARRLRVSATGRGTAGGRTRSAELWLPAADGTPAALEAAFVPPVEAAG
ncbi:hypothetical protein [Sporichthya polymorpha]|uniref:hypothetical protein n=1 Tax=Sporichthya polymorpha TaxID=35751 RepID=UPI0012EBEBCC|nr:hypothetical protein [Sporichthya polymorpha]